jgi:polar amino acid transport system substrate-binding protein
MQTRSADAVTRRSIVLAATAALAGCAAAPTAGPAPSQAKADLASTGQLRAAIDYGNPVLASRGPDGRPRGVSVDLAHAVARRLDLPLRLVTFNTAGQVTEALKQREVDLGFVAIDPVRGADVDYTPPYVIVEADARRAGRVRPLPGRPQVIEQAMAVPRGRTGAQQWLSGFVEEMKASGFVAQALKRHGIEGAGVAPPSTRR